MNWHGLIMEQDGEFDLLRFQGRAIVFDLDSEHDRKRLGDLGRVYHLAQIRRLVGAYISAEEWIHRCKEGEDPVRADQPAQVGAPAIA